MKKRSHLRLVDDEPPTDTSAGIAPAQLGRLGGDAHFEGPGRDTVTDLKHGIAPEPQERDALVPWWYVWL